MGSMLEKITLYDILGYLLPGCLLETIVCLEYMLEKWVLADGVMERIKEILEQYYRNVLHGQTESWDMKIKLNMITEQLQMMF